MNHCPGAKLAGSSGVTHSGEQEGERNSPPANLKRVTAEAVKREGNGSQVLTIVNPFNAFVLVYRYHIREKVSKAILKCTGNFSRKSLSE